MKILAAMLLACLLVSCGKKEEQPPPSTNHSSGNPLSAPADYLGAVNQAQKAASRTVDLASLKTAIAMFQANEDRYPKDLAELAQKKYLPEVPVAPSGSRFVYNPANGEVKVTKVQ